MGINLEKFLQNFLTQQHDSIYQWILNKTQSINSKPIIYNSMDLRNSGFKLAPVDVNFFPAGFNNLDISSENFASKKLQDFFNQNYPNKQNILLIGENHDRNLNYLESLYKLSKLIKQSGKNVLIANLVNQEIKEYTTQEGNILKIDGIKFNSTKQILTPLINDGYIPDIIINNNDLSSGLPEYFNLINYNQQSMLPNFNCGWFRRKKSTYFKYYKEICEEFCTFFAIDPWFFMANFAVINEIDFKEKTGLEKLVEAVEKINNQTLQKYQEYTINRALKPYCFIKANNGTYGMGVISVENPQDLLNLNKNDRKKMHSGKQGLKIDEVLIQEGIPTIEKFGTATAEKTAYLMAGELIGGFYRCNIGKNSFISLNASSSFFEKIPLQNFDSKLFHLVSQLAYLAALNENQQNCI